MNEHEKLAELTAQAMSATFYIGVRPHGRGWFASCNGTEWDGDSPATAVYSVIENLAENLRKLAITAGADAKSLEQKAADLADTAALIDPRSNNSSGKIDPHTNYSYGEEGV